MRKDPGHPKDGFLGKVGIPGDAVLKMCIRLAIAKSKIVTERKVVMIER